MTNPLDKIVENTPKKEAYEVSLGGFKLKLNNTMIAMAIPILSALGGTMWGAFEFYQDYMDMKAKIQKYIAPDLTEFDKRLAVIEQNQDTTSKTLQDSASKTADYTRDIKNDLKQDIRRIESVVENVERTQKQSSREVDLQVREVQTELRKNSRDIDQAIKSGQRETDQAIKNLQREVDSKIQKAMDNPLSR